MSRRYPSSATCPDCGLTVPATASGKLRSHVNMTMKAGLHGSACLDDSTTAQHAEAAIHRRAAEKRPERTTKLPPHLR